MRDFKLTFGNSLAGFSLAAALIVSGCKREQVSSYQVPKEDHSVKPLSMPGMGPGMMGGNAGGEAEESAPPQLKWTVPTGWVEKTGQQQQMGVGAFHVDGGDGKYADIRVIPLRAGPEIEQRSVSMWREELGLPELQVDQIKGEDIEAGGATGHFYDLKSDEPRFAGKYKAHTTAAILEKGGTLYFVKMAGEDSVVSAQQQNFKDFLKSFHFEGGMPSGHPQIASAAGGGAGGTSAPSNWKTPAGWKQLPPRQMVIAAYQANKGGGAADITVTSFPGDVGGLLANVNRWRGQVGLGAIDAGDLVTQVKSVDLSDGSKASVVDVTGVSPSTGKAARLYGLIVPRGGKTWFYKMLGDADVVGAETANLVEFSGIAH